MPAGAVIWPKLDIMCFAFLFPARMPGGRHRVADASAARIVKFPSVLRAASCKVCHRAKKRFVAQRLHQRLTHLAR